MARRIHAVLENSDFYAKIREGMGLFSQTVQLVAGGADIPELKDRPGLNSVSLVMWAQSINMATKPPVDISTGCQRTMLSMRQRIEAPDGKYAIVGLYIYWDTSEVLIDVEGDPQALALCVFNSTWMATDSNYSPLGPPTSLELAIAAAADH